MRIERSTHTEMVYTESTSRPEVVEAPCLAWINYGLVSAISTQTKAIGGVLGKVGDISLPPSLRDVEVWVLRHVHPQWLGALIFKEFL